MLVGCCVYATDLWSIRKRIFHHQHRTVKQNSSRALCPRFLSMYNIWFVFSFFPVVQSLFKNFSSFSNKERTKHNSMNNPNIRHVSICYCAPVKRLRTLHFNSFCVYWCNPFQLYAREGEKECLIDNQRLRNEACSLCLLFRALFTQIRSIWELFYWK